MARPNKIKYQPRPIRLYTYVNQNEESQIKEAADMEHFPKEEIIHDSKANLDAVLARIVEAIKEV